MFCRLAEICCCSACTPCPPDRLTISFGLYTNNNKIKPVCQAHCTAASQPCFPKRPAPAISAADKIHEILFANSCSLCYNSHEPALFAPLRPRARFLRSKKVRTAVTVITKISAADFGAAFAAHAARRAAVMLYCFRKQPDSKAKEVPDAAADLSRRCQ